MQLFVLTLVLLALCFAALGIRIWIKGEFTETEIGHNKHMNKLGIKCVKSEELKQHQNNSNTDTHDVCSACSCFAICDKHELRIEN
jgi:hypothetical protein